jgi:hypothetical protein
MPIDHEKKRGAATGKAAVERGECKPLALPVCAEDVPAQLRERDQWVCWRFYRQAGKWTKLPVSPRTGGNASSTDPDTWGTFAEALAYHRAHPDTTDGVGYVFSVDDPFAGVDLDDALDPATRELKPWARRKLNALDTYTETSPGGLGTKSFLRGKKPGPRCKTPYEDGEIELYDHGRFFCVTGARLEDWPAAVEERQQALEALYAELFPPAAKAEPKPPEGPAAAPTVNGAAGPTALTDDEIIDLLGRAKNSAKFRALWSGDITAYRDDDSRADEALCCLIAFYTRDAAQIGRIFGRSRLVREKWTGRPDYVQRTIARALELVSETYRPPPGRSARFGLLKACGDSANGDGHAGAASGRPQGEPGWATEAEAPPDDGDAPEGPQAPRCGYTIILDWYRTHYQPVFRRGTVLYSGALGREVKAAEALLGAGGDLLVRLARAEDAPRLKDGSVDGAALPRFFSTWCRSAWVDLLRPLPEEDTCVEISDAAGEEFRAKLKAAMHTLVSKGKTTHDREGALTEVERRALIDWCVRWAKPGRWECIRGHQLWVRREPVGESDRLAVALRVELFHQLHFKPFASFTQNKFGRLATLYGVGEDRANPKVNGVRCTILTPEFIHELLVVPAPD